MADDRTRVPGTVSGRAAGPDSTRVSATPVPPPAPTSAPPASAAATSAFGAPQHAGPPPVQVGEVLGHTYRIEAFLAKGGMGAVYRARHVVLESEHAIKVILSELAEDPQVIALMNQEARTLHTVKNDAVVEYQGLMLDEYGRRYLVMEFVDGPSLAHVIKDRRLTPGEVRTLRERLARGLAAAHEKGVYHRDVSPDNVILPGGNIDNAKIIDFGIAKSTATGEKTLIGRDFAGKYSYASPEQAGMYGGKVDGRSDIYSLGLVLASAAIGFGGKLDMGNSLSSMFEARQKVPDLSRVPAELRDELAAMLQPKPEDRIQTMEEVVALGAGRGSSGAVAAPVKGAPGRPAKGGRHGASAPVVIVAAVTFALVVVGGAAYFLLFPSRAPTPAVTVAEHPAPPPATLTPELAQPQPSPPVESVPPVSPPSTPPPQVGLVSPPPRAALTPADAVAQIRQATEGFPCAEIKPTVTDARDVRLEGFVSSSDDLDKLRSALAGIPDLGPVGLDSLKIYGWPHCEVIKLLDETAAPARPGTAPRLAFNISSLVYKDGDKLIVQANATSAYDGFLYVDYLDSEGTVLHMLPAPEHPDNRLRAEQGLRLGGDLYAIGAPFGPNLVVAISSPKRLFPPRAEQQESARAYLPVLTKALEAAASSGPRPVAAYTLISTVAR
jgi:eukaryotic-like serine/threonine-protein kinase